MKELYRILKQLDLPVAYRKFNSYTELPYIVYYVEDNNDFYADNLNYKDIPNIAIDLYTDYKDPDLENKLGKLLNDNKIVYSKSEYYITTEDMYKITYMIRGISIYEE